MFILMQIKLIFIKFGQGRQTATRSEMTYYIKHVSYCKQTQGSQMFSQVRQYLSPSIARIPL